MVLKFRSSWPGSSPVLYSPKCIWAICKLLSGPPNEHGKQPKTLPRRSFETIQRIRKMETERDENFILPAKTLEKPRNLRKNLLTFQFSAIASNESSG